MNRRIAAHFSAVECSVAIPKSSFHFCRPMPRILSGDPLGSCSAYKRVAVHKEQTGKMGLSAVRSLGKPIYRPFAKGTHRTCRETTKHSVNNMATTN